ncbi:MAG: DUF4443 domain-containing protein [Nitrososphaerales archaeon]
MEKLEAILASDYKGPRAGFTEAHVLKALLTIGSSTNVGRGKLGALLDLGQGEVRTLIKRLKEAGLITVEERGCLLTQSGKREWSRIKKLIPWSFEVDGKSLGLGDFCWIVNVRGKSDRIRNGLEQRDASVKAGARGALTVVYSSGKFKVPPDVSDSEATAPSELWTTIRSWGVNEGDALIISGSNDLLSAEYGALSAALSIL